jgi:hypothetical protein
MYLLIRELKLAKDIIFKLIEKWLFLAFATLSKRVFRLTEELFRGYEMPSIRCKHQKVAFFWLLLTLSKCVLASTDKLFEGYEMLSINLELLV